MGWVSRAKAVNLAALVFLAFAFLWLAIFVTALAGVPLAEGAQWTSMVQGLCALSAACLLVARLTVSPVAALALSLVIWLAPMVLPQSASAGADVSADSEKIALQLALPDPLRSEEGRLHANSAHQQGYQDPAVLQTELKERQERVGAWLEEHKSEVSRILSEFHGRGLPPQAILAARVKADLALYKGGTDWTWFESFLERARKEGLDDAPRPLTPDEQKQALQSARSWLRAHPIRSGMQPYSNPNALPDPEGQFQQARRRGISLMALWVILPALGAAWIGRESFVRPWSAPSLPGWVVQGLLGLLRQKNGAPDPQAPGRVLAGLAVLTAGVLLAGFLRWRQFPGAKGVAMLAVAVGGSLLLSGLNLRDEPDPSV